MARVNTYGLLMKGLKKASGETKDWGYYSPHYSEIFYDMETGEVWTVEQYDLGHNSLSVYSSPDIIKIGNASHHWTMQTIADAIAEKTSLVAAERLQQRKEQAIIAVLEYEIDKGQEAYEMLMDGYDGCRRAYVADYASDYEAEETVDGIVVTLPYSGKRWMVMADGSIFAAEWHIYTVIDENGNTVLKTVDETRAYRLVHENEALTYLEDGMPACW